MLNKKRDIYPQSNKPIEENILSLSGGIVKILSKRNILKPFTG
jgi:hypothetical protein